MDSSGEKEIATLTASHVEQGAVGNPVVGDMENKGHSMESDEEKMQVDQERPDKKSENETGDSNEVGNEVMAQNGVDSVEGTGVPGLGEKTTDTSSVAEGEKEKNHVVEKTMSTNPSENAGSSENAEPTAQMSSVTTDDVGEGGQQTKEMSEDIVAGTTAAEEIPCKVVEEISNEVVEEAQNKPAEETPSKAVEDVPNKAAEEVQNKPVEETPSKVVEEVPDKAVEEGPKKIVQEETLEATTKPNGEATIPAQTETKAVPMEGIELSNTVGSRKENGVEKSSQENNVENGTDLGHCLRRGYEALELNNIDKLEVINKIVDIANTNKIGYVKSDAAICFGKLLTHIPEQENIFRKLVKYCVDNLSAVIEDGPAGKRKVSSITNIKTKTGGEKKVKTGEISPKKKDASVSDEPRFVVVTNDGSEQNLIWLINVKEIFAKQLPKMPREYIVRLVMDRNHHSLLCLRGNDVVGGICFRPYLLQRFAEIAFCAVSATNQVRGFGTLLMNHLKQYVKTIRLTHFLTYADNYAIGYFRKQGFTKAITLPRERWRGYIKDYDGGTLMECAINEYVDYLGIPKMIAAQRKFLYEKIKEVSKEHIVYPGLTLFREGVNISNIVEQIPGIKQAGWQSRPRPLARVANELLKPIPAGVNVDGSLLEGTVTNEKIERYRLMSSLQTILRLVRSHRDSWPFHEPVPDTVADYLEVVRDPIDLSLIKKRLDHGQYYKHAEQLRNDLTKMCANCRLYNHPDTQYYKAADTIERYFTTLFQELSENSFLPIKDDRRIR
mmetsp:Transcript_35389/g.56546  ORF Transcript_35389/g.56546 Transcript_35389/m.56546 type:complete len:781 (-) Transcript_35389:34-2376(-)